MNLKICFNPKTREIIKGETRHSEMIRRDFDKWVRALYFEKEKRLYFRFYDPAGNYQYLTEEDHQRSFDTCEAALKEFQRVKLIGKNIKILFWNTDKKISETDIKY